VENDKVALFPTPTMSVPHPVGVVHVCPDGTTDQ
jgi:hypothetical protein